jgi:hypothetical protein
MTSLFGFILLVAVLLHWPYRWDRNWDFLGRESGVLCAVLYRYAYGPTYDQLDYHGLRRCKSGCCNWLSRGEPASAGADRRTHRGDPQPSGLVGAFTFIAGMPSPPAPPSTLLRAGLSRARERGHSDGWLRRFCQAGMLSIGVSVPSFCPTRKIRPWLIAVLLEMPRIPRRGSAAANPGAHLLVAQDLGNHALVAVHPADDLVHHDRLEVAEGELLFAVVARLLLEYRIGDHALADVGHQSEHVGVAQLAFEQVVHALDNLGQFRPLRGHGSHPIRRRPAQ